MRGVGTQRANKSKVTFNEKDEVKEYDPADPAAAAPPAETPPTSSAPKRGRPPKPVEVLTPLEQAEKRMKTAVHKYQEEKDALWKKVIELKGELAWMDHPSTVARLEADLTRLSVEGPSLKGGAVAGLAGVPPRRRGELMAHVHVLCRLRGEAPELHTAEQLRGYLAACGVGAAELEAAWAA